MYRVLITEEMRSDAKKYALEMANSSIKNNLLSMMRNLKPVDPSIDVQPYKKYIKKLHDEYGKILTLLPSEFQNVIDEFHSDDLSSVDLNKEFISRGSPTKFHKMLLSKMQYKQKARSLMLMYLKKYGFETCVYCNILDLEIKERENVYKQNNNGDLDHFWDKAQYPFLCTSFFNLYPCCGGCNGPSAKSTRHILFYPYREESESVDPDPFEYKFDWGTPSAELPIKEEIKISLSEKGTSLGDTSKRYEEIFNIVENNESNLKDKAFLAFKRKIKQQITLPKVFLAMTNGRISPSSIFDEDTQKEILDTMYTNPEDIHKSSLTKFKIDLGKDLGILPK